MIRRLVFLSLLAFAALPLRGQDRPMEATGDISETDGRTKENVLRGNARVTDGVTLITADEIRYNAETQTIVAVGNAVYTSGDRRLLADKLTFAQRDQTFSAVSVRFGAYPYFAQAESASGSNREITFVRATVTYGEPGPWQPTLRADSVTYDATQRRLRGENAQAGIGHLQPLPFPRLQQSLKQPLAAFATANAGYRSTLGVFAELGLHLPVTAHTRLGGDIGLYSERGVMFGPSGRYGRAAGGDSELRGTFRTGYINDHGNKEFDLLGRPVPENRGYIEWQHEQKLTANLALTAQLNWWKDSEVLRDFRPRVFFPVQEPDTFVEAIYTGQNYFLSAFSRLQPNDFNRIQERLPEVRFDLLPFTVGNGFSQRFEASAAVLRESSVADGRAVPSVSLQPAGPGNYI